MGEILDSIYAGTFGFENPQLLYIIIPMIIIIALMLIKSFVAIDKRRLKNPKFLRSRRYLRIYLFFSRVLIFASLIIALAYPFGEIITDTPGDPTITLLIDNSTSMQLFDISFTGNLQKELEERLPVKTAYISTAYDSDIGDGILSNLEKDKNLLLISDGQATSGTSMMDAMLYAASLNSSISAINLEHNNYDIGVSIKGPTKTISEVENFYKVKIDKTAAKDKLAGIRLIIAVDDDIIYDEITQNEEYIFSQNFSDGYHRITARISPDGIEDHFSENNVYYKTTHVIPKPKILLVTHAHTALQIILNELYDVTQVRDLPTDPKEYEGYYAVVINDLPITALKNIEALNDYVIEGNGLFVIGGYNSFDNGGYKNSAFESLLPVKLGKGEEKKGDANIVIVIDISGSFTENNVQTTALSTSKALAYDVVNRINEKNNVGIVAFDEWPYLVSELQPLFVSKVQVLDKLQRIHGQGGQTEFAAGLKGAFNLLRGRTGSKNIIFISDGFTWNDLIQQEALDVAKSMRNYGIKIFTVGTGRNLDEKFLRELTTTGGGIYFTADTQNRLQILFGEAQQKDAGSAFSLFAIDPYHFITEDLETTAVLYGYNQVVPKTNAQLLITTDAGEPAVVVWRHGLGRVSTLTTFSSGNNLGELLNKENSRLLTRITNWAIGDPERKNDFYVDVKDARVNKTSEIIVRSKTYPKVKGLDFSKVDKDTYRSYYINNKVGFRTVLGAIFGVNYMREHQNIGINEELQTIVQSTNGKMFNPTDIDGIVEHVKSVSKRKVTEQKSFRIYFVYIALLLLVLEIIIRRIRETWFMR